MKFSSEVKKVIHLSKTNQMYVQRMGDSWFYDDIDVVIKCKPYKSSVNLGCKYSHIHIDRCSIRDH